MSGAPTTSTDPTASVDSTTIELLAAVVCHQLFSVTIDRDASVASLLEMLRARQGVPHEFTAYSTQRGDSWLHLHTPEYRCTGGPLTSDILLKYTTPTAQLDPSKTVADFFGDAPMGQTVHMLLVWSQATLDEFKRILARKMASEEAIQSMRAAGWPTAKTSVPKPRRTASAPWWWLFAPSSSPLGGVKTEKLD